MFIPTGPKIQFLIFFMEEGVGKGESAQGPRQPSWVPAAQGTGRKQTHWDCNPASAMDWLWELEKVTQPFPAYSPLCKDNNPEPNS